MHYIPEECYNTRRDIGFKQDTSLFRSHLHHLGVKRHWRCNTDSWISLFCAKRFLKHISKQNDKAVITNVQWYLGPNTKPRIPMILLNLYTKPKKESLVRPWHKLPHGAAVAKSKARTTLLSTLSLCDNTSFAPIR